VPAVGGAPDDHAGPVTGNIGEFGGLSGLGHHMPDIGPVAADWVLFAVIGTANNTQ
jgi:hypothetical protein